MPDLGKHQLHREGDLIVFVWNGEVSPNDMAEVLQEVDQVGEEHGFAYVLVDTRAAGRLGPEARRIASEWRHPRDFPAVAIFGASFTTKVVVNMLPNIYALLTGKPPTFAHYTETEAEARAWLEGQRRAREQKKQGA